MCKNIIHFYIIVILLLFWYIPFMPTYHHAYESTTSYSFAYPPYLPSCTWTYLFIFLGIHVFLSSFFVFSPFKTITKFLGTWSLSFYIIKIMVFVYICHSYLLPSKPNHLTPFINILFYFILFYILFMFVLFIFLKVNNLPLSNLFTILWYKQN
jgi:hypothetical protein